MVPYTREEGIRAIIDLQELDGVEESRSSAERGWDSMNAYGRKRTQIAHMRLCLDHDEREPN